MPIMHEPQHPYATGEELFLEQRWLCEMEIISPLADLNPRSPH